MFMALFESAMAKLCLVRGLALLFGKRVPDLIGSESRVNRMQTLLLVHIAADLGQRFVYVLLHSTNQVSRNSFFVNLVKILLDLTIDNLNGSVGATTDHP